MQLESKQQQINAEKEAHKATKEQLEKALRDVKKKNVLSLEMEDYERSMKDLTTKMEENKKKIIQVCYSSIGYSLMHSFYLKKNNYYSVISDGIHNKHARRNY